MKRMWWLALVFIVVLILPLITGEFWVHVLVEILILGLFAASFNMIFGYMGQLSFGHAAYYGVGAYATGLLMVKGSVPLPICLLASMIVAGLCALILGYFCVRLTGIYFAILTLAFGQLIYYIIFQWYSFTGGDDGLQGIIPPDVLLSANAYYYFTLIIVVAALIAIWRISESPFGYTMRAIRENTERTRFIGINIRRYMLINFVIAGIFAGLAGALWGPFNRSIAPDLCTWHQSGIPVFMTVIGGPFNFFGPMVGSVIYTFLMAFVTGFTEYWPLTIGLIITCVVLFMPGGVLGLCEKKIRVFRSRAPQLDPIETTEGKSSGYGG
ncbi:MAG: branched-chain amino acid ABC transporter permease [Deltaproteobacteria bacterium]|nr:MAG: branched-chain amino acid ABC transporter permease [Deltaproteobacteria bacterium]